MKLLLVTHSYAGFPMNVFTGSQRAFSMAKHLPSHGVEVVVISSTSILGNRKGKGDFGERIFRELDLTCAVQRIFLNVKKNIVGPVFPPGKATNKYDDRGNLKFHVRLCYVPPGRQIFWAIGASFLTGHLHRIEKFDLVLTTSPYEANHWVGWFLKRHYGVPWIADLRDGWMYEPYRNIRKGRGLRKGIEMRMEKLLLSRADGITAVTQPLVDDMVNRLGISEKKAFLIPNGFEPDEWIISKSALDKAKSRLKGNKKRMVMLHMGRLSKARQEVDITSLLKALGRLKRSSPSLTEKLALHFIGVSEGPEVKKSWELNLQGLVYFHPPISKEDAVAFMKAADVLLLVTPPSLKSIATSKLFDYMAADKPILGLAQENAAAEIILKTGIGMTVSPNDENKIFHALKDFLSWWEDGRFPFVLNKGSVGLYDRKRIAAELTEIFGGILNKKMK